MEIDFIIYKLVRIWDKDWLRYIYQSGALSFLNEPIIHVFDLNCIELRD